MIGGRALTRRGLLLGLCALVGVSAAPAAADPGAAIADSVAKLLGRFEAAKAEALARVWLSSAEAAGSDSVRARAMDALVLAFLYGGKWSDESAERMAYEVVTLKERHFGPRHTETAASLRQLGFFLYRAGKFREARPHAERALSILEAANGPTDRSLVPCLHSLANIEEGLADFEAARVHYNRWREVAETTYGPDHAEVANALNSLCIFHRKVGEYAAAYRACERSLAIKRRLFGSGHRELANTLLSLGNLEIEMGDNEGAHGAYAEALGVVEATLPESHPNRALVLSAVGGAQYRLGRLEDARDTMRRALVACERALGPDSPQSVITLTNLADVLADLGSFEEARACANRALEVRTKAFGARSLDVARSLLTIGRVAYLSGDAAGSVDALTRCLAVRTGLLPEDHPEIAEVNGVLASSLARSGRVDEAIRLGTEAAHQRATHLRQVARFADEQAALTYVTTHHDELDRLMAIAAASPAIRSDTAGLVWDAVIRSRAVVLDELADRRHRIEVSTDPEVARRAQAFDEESRSLAHLLLSEPSDGPEEFAARVLESVRRCGDAERALAEVSACFQDQRNLRTAGFSQVRGSVPPRTALIAYSAFAWPDGRDASTSPRTYAAFCLLPGSAPRFVRLASADTLETAIDRWRALAATPLPALRRESIDRKATEAGREVRRLLWDPLELPASGLERLLIVPDGKINLVNVAALPTEGEEFLAETMPPLHYLSAERDLVATRSCEVPGRGLVAFGDPSFGAFERSGDVAAAHPVASKDRSGEDGDCDRRWSIEFAPLGGAGHEALEVARIWERSQGARGEATEVRLREQATEQALQALASSSRVLHLATHAFFFESPCGRAAAANPLVRTGFALSGANGLVRNAGEDGMITAQEIGSLDLRGVEWAVLSGCSTGAGELVTGEGILGLRRAFQIAGAHSVIMSLWPVQDSAARAWMTELYEAKWVRGLDTASAVQAAYRKTLAARRSKGQSTHPYEWAAFVAAGDWR
jgi:CHAT domain-containing protein/tetratricopeptide (TPR) repeat protein